MNRLSTRSRLLGSVMLGAGSLALAPTAASASCVVTATTVTCDNTTTTNTTYVGPVPSVTPHATDREYLADTSTAAFTGTVTAGATVNGYGLAFTNSVGGTNALNVVNNGTVTVNAGNAPSAGGTAALDISAIGATPVNYSGAGDVFNLGTGNGLSVDSTGTGAINVNAGGSFLSTTGSGIQVFRLVGGTSGAIGVTTVAGETIRAGYAGIDVRAQDATSTSAININNAATIGSITGAPGTLIYGIYSDTAGSGALTIQNSGNLGTATDVVSAIGIAGTIINTTSTAGLSVTNSGNTFTGDAGISAVNNGQGTITVSNSGALTSTAGPAIFVQQAGTGTTGTVSITNSGALTAATNGIQSSNAGTGGISIANTGAVTATLDGLRARQINATSTGAVSVTGTGAISSGRTGIVATTLGTGPVTVNYTGAVNSTGARGIDVAATTGATSVTTGAGAVSASGVGGVGINVAATTGASTVTTGSGAVTGADYGIQVATTGTQAITANGVTTGTAIAGIHSNTTANRTITVGTAGNVTGGTQAILIANTGTATVTNNGIVGGAATGLAINAATAGATSVTNSAGATLNGRLTLSANADSVTNSGTWNTNGATDFGVGTDALTNNAGGTINVAGDSTFANLETFTQNGRINLNTFTLTGPAIVFTNGTTGIVDTAGNAGLGGFTAITNNGIFDLAAGTFTAPAGAFTNSASGIVIADEGATTITRQTSFANAGTIDLQDDAVGDVLTLNSSYAGSGAAQLQIDTDGTTADRLVINGAASGSTAVDVNVLAVNLAAPDLLVVDTVSTTPNAFVIGDVTGAATPLASYSIVQSGQDYFLAVAPTAAAFDPLQVIGVASDFWYQSADEVLARTRMPNDISGVSFWGQVYASRDKTGDDDTVTIDGVDYNVDNERKTKRYGIQAGVDFGTAEGFRGGLTGGYGWADGRGRTDLDVKGWNLGLYGQFGGTLGFHGEALIKHDRYEIEFADGVFDGVSTDARATGVDGALGYRFGIGGEAALDVNAGVSHVRTKIDGVDEFGFGYDFDRVTSTRGRAGVRANLGGSLKPFVDATVYHEFDGDGRVTLLDSVNAFDLDTEGKGTWLRLEGGIGGAASAKPLLAVWGDIGDRKAIGLRAGFRFGGARAEAPLPPPPPPMAEPAPPPPPPPATQTCPDGSVILATDACPPPPPPPPPVAEPERG